jgi:hypothetical protein
VGRNEKKPGGRRGSRERERHADTPRRVDQCAREIAVFVAFRSVANAELDAEIYANPDEQYRERDRDRIERADKPQPERSRDDQADGDADENGQDDLWRLEREPQDGKHDDDRADRVRQGVLLQGGKFLVLDRHRTGQPHPGLVLRVELEIGGSLPNRLRCPLAGLEGGVIKHRPDLDVATQIAGLGRLTAHHLLPGEARWPAGQPVFQRDGGHRQGMRHGVERDALDLNAGQPEREDLRQAS